MPAPTGRPFSFRFVRASVQAHLVVTDLEESMALVDVHLMPNHSPFSAGGIILALGDKVLTVFMNCIRTEPSTRT